MSLININKNSGVFSLFDFDLIDNEIKNENSFFDNFFNIKKINKYVKAKGYKDTASLIYFIEQSTSFINTQFKSSGNPPIELYIVPIIDEGKSSRNKTKDEGAVFSLLDSKRGMADPHILISQNYSLGLDKGKVVAQSLFSSLGQEDFAKTIFYHETGHYLDYLLSHGLLTDVAQNQNLLSTSFLDRTDPLYQDFLKSWQPTLISEDKYDENDIDYLFRGMMQESAADCWACICLFQEKMQNGLIDNKTNQEQFKAIISATIKARKLSHNNNPESEYATYNALTRLYYNYKKYKPQNNQDWVDLVQKSIQQGLVLNLEEIVSIKYNNHRKLTTKIIEYKDRKSTGLGFQQQRQNMINKLKSHKINRRNPDRFTV